MVEEEKKSTSLLSETHTKSFGEYEAGIQEYLSAKENTTIQCVIKHRFSDFIVNEIDEHGKIIWFSPENDLQKWKKVNIEKTLPAVGESGEAG